MTIIIILTHKKIKKNRRNYMKFSEVPLVVDDQGYPVITRPINWNKVDDPKDLEVWNKLTEQFWLPEKVSLSNDLGSWRTLTEEEQLATSRVLTSLSGLDTLQAMVGSVRMMQDARTMHEVAVLGNITFMEEVHSKSYSSTASTFLSSEENEEQFRWFAENKYTQAKVKIITDFYHSSDALMIKAASTYLEGFMFYSGFFLPLWWSSKGKMTNLADLIRLILRDEAVHCTYISYKFQLGYNELPKEEQEVLKDKVYDLLQELYEVESAFAEEIYDPIGLTEEVKKYMRFNANKSLTNLGFDPLFSAEDCIVNPAIKASMAPSSENHDFFSSSSGSSYVMAKHEELDEDDWDF